jgi:rSAM/selenodomain-associated transferase 2
MLSVVIPTLNEGESIVATLACLQVTRCRGDEVIVIDGGSTDETVQRAKPFCDRIESAPAGRALQMNAGAALARGDIFLFLHADTLLPPNAGELVRAAIAQSGRVWGRFDVDIDSPKLVLRLVAELINLRSRWSGIATGDQAIFVQRDAFESVGGYPSIPIMEDVALSRALKRSSQPVCLRDRALTSGRRWERRGILRTVILMWLLRLAYFCRVDPRRLASHYEPRPHA